MNYIWKYKTPEEFDDLVMHGDDEALTGLWFEGSRDDMRDVRGCERRETPVFRDTCRWLDAYFAGHDPGFMPRYRIDGATPFRRAVIDEMLKIPYGATVSYGDIAKALERKRGGRVSAQAVGGAVGWNPKTGRTQRKGVVMMMVARCDAGKFSDRIDKMENELSLSAMTDVDGTRHVADEWYARNLKIASFALDLRR